MKRTAVLMLFLTSMLVMLFYAAPVTGSPGPGPGPSAEITVLDPYNQIPVGSYDTFDVRMNNTGDPGVPHDVLWNITLTAVVNNSLVGVMADADVIVYRSDDTTKWLGTVSGTTETNLIYAPWSTAQGFSAVTWTLPGTVTLEGEEHLIITIELHCLGEGPTLIHVFPRATEDHHDIPPQDLGSISDQKNLFLIEDHPKYADGWYPLHNSYDPYDDPIPGLGVSNGHSWDQHSWNSDPTIHAYAKDGKAVEQVPPVECQVTFYTHPDTVGSITFMSQTYTNGQSHTFPYDTSDWATANAPAGWVFDHWEVTLNVQVSDADANPTEVTITCGGTLKAVFREAPTPPPQYYLTLATSPSGVTTPSGERWYDAGTYASISTDEFVNIVPDASRYRFVDWTTADMTEISDPASPYTTVWIDKAKTVTANYVTQYYLTVISPYDTPGGMGWYDSSTDAYATLVTGILDHGNGTRRMFTHWSADASGTNYAKSDPIHMDGPKTAIANWKTQYLLAVRTDPTGLSPQPTRNPTGEAAGSWWYDSSTNVVLTAQAVSGYTFLNWDIDGTSQGGSVNPITVRMDGPHTATAHYQAAPPPPPVGGVWVPINKFDLLAPWIGLASLITVAAMSIVYVKHRKKTQP